MSSHTSNRIVVILGMHQSGVSLVAEVLSALDVNLGAASMTFGRCNKSYVHPDIGQVSKLIMSDLHRDSAGSLGAAPLPDNWIDTAERIGYRAQLTEILKRELASTSGVFGFTDPYTMRLLPLWQRIFDELGIEARYLLSLRHPLDVVEFLARHNQITQAAAELLWCTHHAEAIDSLGTIPDCVITYEGWRDRPDAQLSMLAERLQLPAADTRIDTILAHHLEAEAFPRATSFDENNHPLTRRLYTEIKQLSLGSSGDGLAAASQAFLEGRKWLSVWAEYLDKDHQLAGSMACATTTSLWAPGNTDHQPHYRELRPTSFEPVNQVPGEAASCIVMPESGEDSMLAESGLPLLEVRLWSLAEHLASTGSRVTVLFPQRTPFADQVESRGPSERISIVIAPQPEVPCRLYGRGPLAISVEQSYKVYEYLKCKTFEVVFLPDFRGIGYFSLAAKQQGIRFENTSFALLLLLPSSIARETRGTIGGSVLDLIRDDMESKCLDLADRIIGTDCVDLGWLQQRGWRVPSIVDFLPLPLPELLREKADSGHGQPELATSHSLAFYGNLDQPAGIHIFCDALDRMRERGVLPTHVYLVSTRQTRSQVRNVRKRLEGFSHSFHVNLEQAERLAILEKPGVLVVTPVMHQMGSAEIVESIAAGIQLVMSDRSPHTAMLHTSSLVSGIVTPHPYHLAEKLEIALTKGLPPSRMSWQHDEINTAWKLLENSLVEGQSSTNSISIIEERAWQDASTKRLETRNQLRPGMVSSDGEPAPEQLPEVSVCLIHFERPDFVNQTIESLELQSYRNFEVILVDDGSKKPETLANLDALQLRFESRGWQVVRQPNLSPGAARNRAASLARGQYLLFMDDDNYAKPHEIETFLQVARHTGADAITCFRDAFVGNDLPPLGQLAKQRIPALGSSISVSNFINCFGDTNALIRKQAYLAVGGYNEQHRTGKEDYEFFCKIALNGFRLITIPEALYWYREHPVKRKRHHYDINAGTLTVMNAFTAAVPRSLRGSVLYARGLSEQVWEDPLTRSKLQARFKFLNSSWIWKLVTLTANTIRSVKSGR